MNEKLVYDTWGKADIPTFSSESDTKGALETLQWAYGHYGDTLVYACSFGIEAIVLLDLISKVKPDAKIVFLDTNLHFKETYETIEKIQERFPRLNIHLQQPGLTLEEQAEKHGEELWKTNPNLCCEIRKVIPLRKAVESHEAWITGLRREQSESRKNTNFLNQDHKFKRIKVCPLIHWTWKEVWRYVYKYDLPYNKLHDQGYPSIGCAPCTLPTHNMEDLRAGRWSGHQKVECGLHESAPNS